MGDLPRGRNAINTNNIFGPAMKNEALKDEIYCQIMKQLTENRIQISEERGWDLMWLATGVMIPSPVLLKELQEFLKTRKHAIALESLQRLQKTMKHGERKYPPYIVEVEAIRFRTIQVYHRVYFPDDTDEAFEIESSTKAKDLMVAITKRLELKSLEGFSLFVKILDKAFSVPEECFIFDFICELVEWMKETYPTRISDGHIQCQYQLFFMKKLWINTVPGKDRNADEIFYYPQEVPKYLNAYYKVTKAEAVKLAALIYRSQCGRDDNHLHRFHDILPRLVPEDLIAVQKADEWKKQIISVYNSQVQMSEDDAKLEFLKVVSEFPMFGSTFFVAKQATDSNLSETILIAINRNGFNIIHPGTKVSRRFKIELSFRNLEI
jgi:myosin VIIa